MIVHRSFAGASRQVFVTPGLSSADEIRATIAHQELQFEDDGI